MTQDEIRKKALDFGQWYHEIELFPGFVTPSNMLASKPQWEQVRKVRTKLDYKGKTVLDLGTMDGMWAFEAEKLGAKSVVGTDIWQHNPIGIRRFRFATEVLNSSVECLPGGNVHSLTTNTRVVRKRVAPCGWDIIQCLGLLYHVQNPLLALHQMASCLAPQGKMLLETAVFPTGSDDPSARFNSDSGIYVDVTTMWAPNWACLLGWLALTGFDVDNESVSVIGERVHRVCLIANRSERPLDPTFGLE